MVDPSFIPQLVPLFAPYCGGVNRERELTAALVRLVTGELRGTRALADGGGHDYGLRWSGTPAPLEPLQCRLSFPDLPAIDYSFEIPCHQLVRWLIEAPGQGLPESFWPWLLQGHGA
ncbi:MAG: type IV pilus biogenesis protein EbsA [Cyanobacteriota bacterium]